MIRTSGLGSLSLVLPYPLVSWFYPLSDARYFIFLVKRKDSLQLIGFLSLLPTNRFLSVHFFPSLSLLAPAYNVCAYVFLKKKKQTLDLQSVLLVSTNLVKSHTTHGSLKKAVLYLGLLVTQCSYLDSVG